MKQSGINNTIAPIQGQSFKSAIYKLGHFSQETQDSQFD